MAMKIELDTEHLAPTLAATNIYLRAVKSSDFSAIKVYRQDPENCRYIRPPDSDKETMALIEQLAKPWNLSLGHWNGLVICSQTDDTLLGEIVFRIEDWQNQRAEIGYRLSPTAAGRGICTEAATLLIDHLFQQLGFHKIVAKCDPRNIASFRVMEKLGFVREAFFKQHYRIADEWTDQYDYGLLYSQWLDKKSG